MNPSVPGLPRWNTNPCRSRASHAETCREPHKDRSRKRLHQDAGSTWCCEDASLYPDPRVQCTQRLRARACGHSHTSSWGSVHTHITRLLTHTDRGTPKREDYQCDGILEGRFTVVMISVGPRLTQAHYLYLLHILP